MNLAYQLEPQKFIPHQPCTIDLLDRVDALMHALCDADSMQASPLAPAIRYHLASGGSRIRASMTLDCADTLMLSDDAAVSLAAVPELLHNASLIHDDLQDGDRLRRGRAALWVAFDQDTAICAGDQMLSAAYGALASYPEPLLVPSLMRRVHLRVSQVINGQTQDLSVAKHGDCSFARYETIAASKSGPLLGLGLELALIAAGFERESMLASQAARDFAIAYQIADDIADQAQDLADHTRPRKLNAANLLREAGLSDPVALARLKAVRSLGRAKQTAIQLPCGAGTSLQGCIDRLRTRLELAS